MTKKQILKDTQKAILLGFIFTIVLSLSRFNASCEDMRQNILRIHIIANSDSMDDQDVKLKVRDALLKECGELFLDCKSLEIAEEKAKENTDKFKNISERVLKENGFNYSANAKIGKSFFDTREYKDFTLPAGYYNSLIITLGKGGGHNWWCVIYPSVCIGSSGEKLDKAVSKKSSKIAENPQKYKIKFKAVEIYEKLKKSQK